MDELLRQSWTATSLGIVFGIISGIAIAYSFKPRPRLAAKTNTLELVGPTAVLPTEVSFLFRGVAVPKVTLSKVAIWNSGSTTLKGDQIVGGDPLRIIVSEGSSILEAIILVRTRTVNDFACSVWHDTATELECRFDYLDPGDGAVIQLIHTGTDNVGVVGTLRGVPRGVRLMATPRAEKAQAQPETSRSVARAIAAAVFLLGVALPVLKIEGGLGATEPWSKVAVASSLLILMSAVALFVSRYLPPARLSTQIGSSEPKRTP